MTARPPRTRIGILAGCLALPVLLGLSGCATAPPVVPIVRTNGGLVTGTQVRDLVVFRGVPYAAPPTGPRRWQPPEPAPAWDGVLDARAAPPACPQPRGVVIDGPMDEDCLRLDVFSPRLDPTGDLPVLVFLHGGAFRFGGATDPAIDPRSLAQRGVVVVVAQYRLGVFGWFAHPALDRDAPDGPCNFGLLDQIAALEWVRDNVAAFGGSPTNVTLCGSAAGATSALYLMAGEPGRGLFQRVILQSPTAFHSPRPRAEASAFGGALLADSGLAPVDATAAQLRAIPAADLARLDLIAACGADFGPILDGRTVHRPPHDAVAAAEQQRLPLLLGATDGEGSIMARLGVQPAAFLTELGAAAQALPELYPEATDDADLSRRAWADAVFVAPTRWLAGRHAEVAPTWHYSMRYVPTAEPGQPGHQPGSQAGGAAGAPHGVTTRYLFRTMTGDPGPTGRWLAETIAGYWIAFARAGDPARDGAPTWPRYDRATDRTMLLQEQLEVAPTPAAGRLDWWIEQFASQAQ